MASLLHFSFGRGLKGYLFTSICERKYDLIKRRLCTTTVKSDVLVNLFHSFGKFDTKVHVVAVNEKFILFDRKNSLLVSYTDTQTC